MYNNNIVQNKVNDELSNFIYNTIIDHNFSWYWNENQVYETKSIDQIGGFTHEFYTQEKSINSTYFPVVSYLLEEVKNVIDVDFIFRAQANLLCNVKVTEEQNKNSLHMDYEHDGFFSILYYVINSDGNTIIYNKDKSILEVSPVKGNYVIFPSSLVHRASPPTDNKRRMVINIIVKGKLKQ